MSTANQGGALSDLPPLPEASADEVRDQDCKCGSKEGSRNLVICIDGTSNKFGKKNTNIIELYSQVCKTDEQLTYYNSGVGTSAKPTGSWRNLTTVGRWVTDTIDLAIAWNMEKIIMKAYRWLSDVYKDGDKIYLFGFSRGAYLVRALAGMIHEVGLILPGNKEQIPLWVRLPLCCNPPSPTAGHPPSNSDLKPPTARELASVFKSTFSRKHVRVHFIGVWDTVSSVGIIRHRTLPSTTTSKEHFCYFRHALALDERRVKFQPDYIFGTKADQSTDGDVKEVWFAGSHSDVYNHKLESGDIPLLWMRNEANIAGLQLVPKETTWKLTDLEKKTIESLTPWWWLLEIAPFERRMYANDPEKGLPWWKRYMCVY
ncbi:hypothetical protein BV22DRAFT_1007450 [Leucogyrophana mollusca]|uniref:Uncharacterized protein n=1 Tax=Leucogyrophana mollusca TaxID=85980 RepID=A0ACB8BNN3_9AGAM|nr:hypothetical protein BV22DRAFT_1007450 [Leucogyrophana mollusca]